MTRARFFLSAAAAAIAATVGATFLAYRSELDRARETAQRRSSVADTAAGRIEYAQTHSGTGAGITLLSIHGAGGGFDQGLANAASLVGDGFHVIAPSRFGYLRTPIPADTSPAAQADAHAALLSKLNVSKAVVVGDSAGARSAVELALRHPDKVSALILVVPGLYSPTSPVSIEASRGSAFAFWIVNAGGDFAWWAAEKIAPSMLIRFLGVRPDVVAAASESDRARVMTIVRSVEPLSLRFPGINVDSRPELREPPLERISAPTLIISARDDLFNTLPAAEFAGARIPGAKLLVLDSGGHLLVGHEQDIRAAVRAFLAGAGLIPPSE
ncbi:MAG: alpha/beta fold hydrolase [Hyphomicrobium sp.]